MAQGTSKAEAQRLTHEEFVTLCMDKLRNPEYKGLHTVYSGFNEAFRSYFGTDPVVATKALQEAGKFVVIPVRGGVTLYFPHEAPERTDKGAAALAKLGL